MAPSPTTIRALVAGDWPRVREIYGEGLETGDASFETAVPEWSTWDAEHLAVPRLVAESERGVLGWAALSPVSGRCVYGGVAEVSVYVAGQARGRGVGARLLERLIVASEEHGLWMLQAGIFCENHASLALHRRCGFRLVGRRERLGRLAGRWRDVLLLERRSKVVGVDEEPGMGAGR